MKSDWQILQEKLTIRFGSELDIDSILFIIGLQELSLPYKKYNKDDKISIMHIAICTLMEPYGFYKYTGRDEKGWPHWELVEKVPHLESKQQHRLMTEAVIDYFKRDGFI